MEKPNSSNALVCELINKGTREWNINNLNSWFLPEDREAILGIPLSSSNTPDRLVWAETRSGKFTVKSAYALALEEKVHNTRADCSDESAGKIWKTIWQLRIPQKIKHFASKAARDILATKSNLAKRKITPNGMCDLYVVKMRKQSVICYGAVIMPKKFGRIAGSGVVIRDDAGEVFAALSKKWKSPLGAIEAEAKALEAGVNFAREVGIREAEFESDSVVICNALQGLVSPPSSVVNVLAGIMNEVSYFRQWKFAHVKRQGNVPAHLLAQHAKNVEDFVAWRADCPSLIEHACMQDKM
ncbi:uncharacterized protein LOC142624996 [Castanea sativa]|uniref:uncharacterized protein LOC142624996 n=1 Tax=Castanea sativa TaxID=21020 RepID=UPI003F649E36